MENASKALLIAGSILIVILLIAMGMKLFNSTQGTIDSAEGTMQATEVAMVNNRFTKYFGNNKSKSDVMSLVNEVNASNAASEKVVTITFSDGATTSTSGHSGTLMQAAANLSSSNGYTIGLYKDASGNIVGMDEKGYINHIQITKQ